MAQNSYLCTGAEQPNHLIPGAGSYWDAASHTWANTQLRRLQEQMLLL